MLLTTQYLDEADQLADRIAVIDRGRVIADGTADELKASVGTSSLQLTLVDRDPDRRTRSRCSPQFLGVEVAVTPGGGPAHRAAGRPVGHRRTPDPAA